MLFLCLVRILTTKLLVYPELLKKLLLFDRFSGVPHKATVHSKLYHWSIAALP